MFMKKNSLIRKSDMRKILVTSIIISLLGIGIQTVSHLSPFIVSAQEDNWILTLRITGSSGREASIVLKGSPNASDGQDVGDIPIPPPPMPPYIRAWFTTSFPIPFNVLLTESKQFPSDWAAWNLSLIWVPELENDSLTTLNITWNPSQAVQSSFDSLQLYERNTSVANMLTENHYSFPSNGSIHHFQIIGQTINDTSGENDFPILPITLGIIVLVIVIIIAVFWYKQKK